MAVTLPDYGSSPVRDKQCAQRRALVFAIASPAPIVYSLNSTPKDLSQQGHGMRMIKPLRDRFLPNWIQNTEADNLHPHRRRFTAAYRRKLDIVRNLWIGSGILMMVQATPVITAVLCIATTFLSFMILDESS